MSGLIGQLAPASEPAIPEGLSRGLMIGGIVLTVAALTIAVLALRKASKLRPKFEIVRLALALGVAAAVGLIVGVSTPLWLAATAAVVGLGLGYGQGAALEVAFRDGGVFVRKGAIAVACWGLGTVAMQAAGLANRTGVFRVGQAVAIGSAAIGVGVMVGRRGPVERARQATAAATAAGAIALLGLALPMGGWVQQDDQVDIEDLFGDGSRPGGICDLVPAQLDTSGGEFESGAGPLACIGEDERNFVSLSEHDSAPEAQERFEQVVENWSDFRGEGRPIAVGEGGSILSDEQGFDAIVHRDRFSWRVGGDGPEATIIDLAEITDDNVRAALAGESTAEPPEPADDPAPAAEVPEAPPEEDSEPPGEPAGDVADNAQPEDDVVFGPDGFPEKEDITTDEGLAASVAMVLTGLLMGVLSLSEASEKLSDLFQRAGREDISDDLLAPFADTPPDDAPDSTSSERGPPGGPAPVEPGGDGTFEPLDDTPGGPAAPSVEPESAPEETQVPAGGSGDGSFEPLEHEGTPAAQAPTWASNSIDDASGPVPDLAGEGLGWPVGTGAPGGDEPLPTVGSGSVPASDPASDPASGEVAPDETEIDEAELDGADDGETEIGETDAAETGADSAGDVADAPTGDVRLDEQEIDDMVRWGRENNRPVEDIQNDLDWLNRARGGAGSVPIPGDVRTIHDPDFGVITDEGSAIDQVRWEQDALRGLDERDRELRDRWDELQTRRRRTKGLIEDDSLLRGAAGLAAAAGIEDEYDEKIAALDDEIREILRSGRLADREVFGSYDAARHREAWQANRHRIPELRQRIGELESERLERIANLHRTDPGVPMDQTSLLNRPHLVLNALDREQDELMEEFKYLKQRRAQLNDRIDDFYRRNGKDPSKVRANAR